MRSGFMVVVAMAMVSLAPLVLGTSHLSFSNNTEFNINAEGCGTSKLCVLAPSIALTVAATGPTPPDGFTLVVQLQGESDGYITLGLTSPITMDVTEHFVCGRNTSFFFRTVDLNGTTFTANERTTREIRGKLNETFIECEFTIPLVNATASRHHRVRRHSHVSTFNVTLATGNLTAALELEPLNIRFTGSLNLANSSTVIDSRPNSTTTTPGVPPFTVVTVSRPTSDSKAIRCQAVLVLLGALAYLLS